MPINLRWERSIAKIIGIYIAGGPDFSFNLNKLEAIEDQIKSSLAVAELDPALLKNETKPLSMIWINKAANDNCVDAQFFLGERALASGDIESAKEWYGKAAEKGLQKAQDKLDALSTGL